MSDWKSVALWIVCLLAGVFFVIGGAGFVLEVRDLRRNWKAAGLLVEQRSQGGAVDGH